MNTFANIKPIARYKKVAYYSVCIDDASVSLFEEFIKHHEVANKSKLNHVLEWMKIIGDKYGARSYLFRPEAEFADASALPPKGIEREPFFIELGKKKANNIRLYCLRANDNVVILFNGDIKTTQYPQDCPNVKLHFKQANQLTKAIDTAFREKEIRWNEDGTLINFDNDFKLFF